MRQGCMVSRQLPFDEREEDAVEQERAKLTRTQLLMLGFIVEQEREGEGAVLTKEEIANAAGCSSKTADRGISYMEEIGIIRREARYMDSGRQLGNAYFVMERGVDDDRA